MNTLTDSRREPPAPPVPFERVVLVGAILFVGYLVSRYDLCFQYAEVLTGNMFDAGIRPRVVSYLAYIASLETRLALWEVVPPHPSFTPIWILTLGAAPVLLFKFLETELRSRRAAIAGVAVYLVSAGCLSGVTMLFHPGKPLANVIVIATLYLSGRIARAPAQPYMLMVGLLALLTAAPFVEETAVFAYAIPLVWCPSYFWPDERSRQHLLLYVRNWLVYLAPAGIGALLMFAVLPDVMELAGGTRFDLIGFLSSHAVYERFDLRHIVWEAGNLLMPGLLPWHIAPVLTPVADGPTLAVPVLLGLAVGLALATAMVRRHRVYWSPYRKLGILMAAFVVFESLVLVFQDEELSATGFYYGAIFSVLFAPLVAVVFADASEQGGHVGSVVARAGLLWVLVVSAVNFIDINATYKAFSNTWTLVSLEELPIYGRGGDWTSIEARRAQWTERSGHRQASVADRYNTPDMARGAGAAFADVFAIWRSWRRDETDFVAGRRLDMRNLWVVTELQMKDQREVPSQKLVKALRRLMGNQTTP